MPPPRKAVNEDRAPAADPATFVLSTIEHEALSSPGVATSRTVSSLPSTTITWVGVTGEEYAAGPTPTPLLSPLSASPSEVTFDTEDTNDAWRWSEEFLLLPEPDDDLLLLPKFPALVVL